MELTARYGALEKDKMDTYRRLKGKEDAKETEERELDERMQAAEQHRHDLKLQHGREMEKLQRRLDDLQSEGEALGETPEKVLVYFIFFAPEKMLQSASRHFSKTPFLFEPFNQLE